MDALLQDCGGRKQQHNLRKNLGIGRPARRFASAVVVAGGRRVGGDLQRRPAGGQAANDGGGWRAGIRG